MLNHNPTNPNQPTKNLWPGGIRTLAIQLVVKHAIHWASRPLAELAAQSTYSKLFLAIDNELLAYLPRISTEDIIYGPITSGVATVSIPQTETIFCTNARSAGAQIKYCTIAWCEHWQCVCLLWCQNSMVLPSKEHVFRISLVLELELDTSCNIAHYWVGTLPSMEDDDELECGPMPNVMVTLPNIGGALCSTPQSLADAHY